MNLVLFRLVGLVASGTLSVALGASLPQPAKAQPTAPCLLIGLDQIKAVLGTPVQPGHAGDRDCTWNDAKGETRVYLSLKEATDYKSFHDSMQATGRLVPVTGIAEDAFFIGSTGNSAALYTLKSRHLLLLTVDGVGFSRNENEAAEKALATQVLAKL